MVFLPFSFSCFFFSISLLVDKCCCCWVASVVSDSVQPRRWQPTRLCCPWDSPGKNTGVGCQFLLQSMKVKSESEVAQSCPTLRDRMDCSLPGSSVHGISRQEYWSVLPLPSLIISLGDNIFKYNLQWARLQQYMNQELPYVQGGFRKGKGTRDQIASICWIIEKSKTVPENHLLLLYWQWESLWLCGSHQNGKFFRRWEYQNTWPASWEICMQVKKQQLELDIKQRTGSKSGKKYIKAAYCHPAYLMYMQIHHAKCQAGWSTRQNQNCWEKYQ